jgi:hypothetical protein
MLIDWLGPILKDDKPDLVIYEAPLLMMPEGKTDEDGRRRGGNAKTMAALIGMACMVEMLCCRWDVRVVQAASQSARKLFCGSGRADKAQVMAECKRRGWNPIDSNDADALCLLAYAIHLYFPDDYRISYRRPAA